MLGTRLARLLTPNYVFPSLYATFWPEANLYEAQNSNQLK